MSRTFKTAPVLVKCLSEPGMIEPEHDHRLGECDLPERPTRPIDSEGKKTVWNRNGTHCYWVPSAAFWRSPLGVCGCSTCGAKWWRLEERRKQRYGARVEIREAFVDLAERGVYDGLGDVRSPYASGDIEDEEHEMYTKLRDALGLAPDCWVIDCDYAEPDFDAYADADLDDHDARSAAMWEAVEGYPMSIRPYLIIAEIKVLYPDGTREWLALDKDGIIQ